MVKMATWAFVDCQTFIHMCIFGLVARLKDKHSSV